MFQPHRTRNINYACQSGHALHNNRLGFVEQQQSRLTAKVRHLAGAKYLRPAVVKALE
jgi:hypothetical protein